MACSNTLVAAVTAAAVFIAENVPDNDELAVIAAVLVQLSDTLNTILATRGDQSKENQPIPITSR